MASSDNPFPASQSPLGLARARSRESREILLATRGPQDFPAGHAWPAGTLVRPSVAPRMSLLATRGPQDFPTGEERPSSP